MNHLRSLQCKYFRTTRHYSKVTNPDGENPFLKTFRTLGNDFRRIIPNAEQVHYEDGNSEIENFPSQADVVIIGGGAMGSSIAYWLRKMAGQGLSIAVVEKDPTYSKASTVLSVGGLRQQFSLPENILMSQFAAEFFRTIKKSLGEDIDVNFTPAGYLLLATEETAQQLDENYKVQKKYNVQNELLNPTKLKQKFPWLNTDGIVMGCHGLENEGWFDPWILLSGFKNKAIQLGATYVKAEAVDFKFEKQGDLLMDGIVPGTYERLRSLYVKTDDGKTREIKFAICVIAAGASSGHVARLAKIGTGKGMLSIPLPIEPRKRFVYCFNSQDKNAPGINTPMTFDPSGTYFRREGLGNNYIGGKAPLLCDEPDCGDLDVDHNFFENHVWPHLAERVPAFGGVKSPKSEKRELFTVNSAWAGFYEFNTYDENGIIGPHPYYQNLYIASGFSGHGIQQAPAVGRAISELILDSSFQTIDLTRLGFDRIIMNKPMYETNIF